MQIKCKDIHNLLSGNERNTFSTVTKHKYSQYVTEVPLSWHTFMGRENLGLMP